MAEERLQKLLARAGVGSRRKVEEMIRRGQVTVNGTVATLGDRADTEKDSVKLDGRRISLHEPDYRYVLLHKPPATMSTTSDPEGRPIVLDLIAPSLRKGLKPVGRLDFQTSGLLLLTNDGDLAQKVAHPRYGCLKTYEVKVKGHPLEAMLDRLRRGMILEGKRTAPCTIERRPVPKGMGSKDNSWFTVILNEGRTRQIREVFLRIGHPVQKLRRVAIGDVADPHMPMGTYRELTEEEVGILRSGGKSKKSRGAAARKAKEEKEGAEGKPERRKSRVSRGGASKGGATKSRSTTGRGTRSTASRDARPSKDRPSKDSRSGGKPKGAYGGPKTGRRTEGQSGGPSKGASGGRSGGPSGSRSGGRPGGKPGGRPGGKPSGKLSRRPGSRSGGKPTDKRGS